MDEIKMLSGQELLDKGVTKKETVLPQTGSKNVIPDGSWLEQKQVQSALEARKQLLDAQRIEKSGILIHAEWLEELKLAKVITQTGSHLQFLGHSLQGQTHLKPEETLFLMETNCLLLTYNEVIVSLQQAYSLLLCDKASLNKYKVYSTLSRVGYKVFQCVKPDSVKKCNITDDNKENEPKVNQSTIYQKNDVDNKKEDSELDNVKITSQEEFNVQFKDARMEVDYSNADTLQTSDPTSAFPESCVTCDEKSNKDESEDLGEDTILNNDPVTIFLQKKLKALRYRLINTRKDYDEKDSFENVPDLLQNKTVTINAPKAEFVPNNIYLNKLIYQIDVDNITSKSGAAPSTHSRTYSVSDEVNGDHIRRVTSARMPYRPQNVQVPPFYQNIRPNTHTYRHFQYWRSQPNTNCFQYNNFFQRPFPPNYYASRFQFHPRMRVQMFPRYFAWRTYFNENDWQTSTQSRESTNTRKRKLGKSKKTHLDTIINIASRFKQIYTTHNIVGNVQALHRLIQTFNIRYKARLRLTDDFEIFNDEKIIDTIELEDDEESSNKRRRSSSNIGGNQQDINFNKIKILALRFRDLEQKNEATTRHRRALSGLIKTFNKTFNADIYINHNSDVIDRRSITLDSSSDSECVVKDVPKVSSGKKLRNPFNILKRLSEKHFPMSGPSTSKDNIQNNDDIMTIDTDNVLENVGNSWLPNPNDFGRPEIIKNDNINIRVIESKKELFVYDFLKDKTCKFRNWVETKVAFLESIEEANAIFQTEALKCNSLEIKSILKSEDCTDMLSVLKKLSIIKTKSDTTSNAVLDPDFDVYNRDVQNFRRTDRPTPHFRVICLDEFSMFPSGVDIATLQSKYDDGVMIVFAVVGSDSVSFLQIIPTDLPVYISCNDLG